MGEIIITKADEVPSEYKHDHEEYEYYKRAIIPRGMANQCTLSVYEVPPGKSAVPYHYHSKNEEVFYIISGSGILKRECKLNCVNGITLHNKAIL